MGINRPSLYVAYGDKRALFFKAVERYYTGLRRGDAARLGRQHLRHGTATLTTEKKGMVVSLPILPVLQKTLEAGPCSDLAFVTSAHGKPFTKESFGNAFAEAARMAGVKKSCHGLPQDRRCLGCPVRGNRQSFADRNPASRRLVAAIWRRP